MVQHGDGISGTVSKAIVQRWWFGWGPGQRRILKECWSPYTVLRPVVPVHNQGHDLGWWQAVVLVSAGGIGGVTAMVILAVGAAATG